MLKGQCPAESGPCVDGFRGLFSLFIITILFFACFNLSVVRNTQAMHLHTLKRRSMHHLNVAHNVAAHSFFRQKKGASRHLQSVWYTKKAASKWRRNGGIEGRRPKREGGKKVRYALHVKHCHKGLQQTLRTRAQRERASEKSRLRQFGSAELRTWAIAAAMRQRPPRPALECETQCTERRTRRTRDRGRGSRLRSPPRRV